MELICRSFYHSFLSFVFNKSGLSNLNAYVCNIKRIESIIRNDYRTYTGEELSAESEGSCSVVSDTVSINENIERTDDFEYPEPIQGDEPEHNSPEQSNGNSY